MLCLVRRKLQEVFDEEDKQRRLRVGKLVLGVTSSKEKPANGSDDLTVPVTAAEDDNSSPGASQVDEDDEDDDEGFGYADQKDTLAIQLESVKKTISNPGTPIGKHSSTTGALNHSTEKKRLSPSCVDLFHQLGVGKAREEDEDDSPANDQELQIRGGSAAGTKRAGSIQWSGFAEQLDFIARINKIVDDLRFVDRPLRTETFCKEIEAFHHPDGPSEETHASRSGSSADPSQIEGGAALNHNQNGRDWGKHLGWDPTSVAGEPMYRIIRVVKEECRVFRTKARAPSLMVCIVKRDDEGSAEHYSSPATIFMETSTAAARAALQLPNPGSNIVSVPVTGSETPEGSNASRESNFAETYSTPINSKYILSSSDGMKNKESGMQSSINQIDHLVESSMEKVKEICERRRSFSGDVLGGVGSLQLSRSKSASCLSDQEEDTILASVSSSSTAASADDSGLISERIKATLSSSSLSAVASSSRSLQREIQAARVSTSTAHPEAGKDSLKSRRNSCFLSANRLNSSAEGILKSALFANNEYSKSKAPQKGRHSHGHGHKSHSKHASHQHTSEAENKTKTSNISPQNFKVTSASLQINDNLTAIESTDHEFVLSEEDYEKLNIPRLGC